MEMVHMDEKDGDNVSIKALCSTHKTET